MKTLKQLRKGDRVKTHLGLGIFNYIRMAPPDFKEVDAVSVFLDERLNVFGYSGTILKPDVVEPVDDDILEDAT